MVPGQQEDAHEFLRYLLEGMERAYLNRHKASKLDSYSKETTPINQIFGGYIRTEVKCLQCEHVSTTFQHFQDLLVDIRKANSLDEALSNYFSREQLDNNDYKCEACKRRVPATKQFTLERPPKVLCVQLKRFSVLGGKISRHIGFKQSVDMGRHLWREPGEPPRKLNYKLMSMVTHMGPSVNCGHYTAIAQVSTGQYYSFDDSCVRSINLSSVLSTNAYIMIFEMESQSLNQLPSPAANKLNGLTSIKSLTNGSCKSSSPKPSTSGLLITNGTSNGTSKITRDNDMPLIGPQLPPNKLQQNTNNFIGPQLPDKLIEKNQPRLVMQIKNGKATLNSNSLVPYDGSSDEDDSLNINNSKNNHTNASTTNKSINSASVNGVAKNKDTKDGSKERKIELKTELKTVKNSNTAQKIGNENCRENGNNGNGLAKHQNGKNDCSGGKNEINGKDKWHHPVRVKVGNDDKVPTKAASSINGWQVSKDAPSPTSGATPNGWSVTDNK